MSDILSRVQILLDANTARFEQNMREAQKTASNTFGKIIDGAKKMAPAVVAGGAIAGAAVIAMTNDYINAANEITRFSTIANATPTEFQRMAIGANTLGFETEELSNIYKDFNEKLGEFTTLGSGGAVDFFEKVAIKTEGSAAGARKLALEMQQLSGPQGLQLYVDKAERAGVTSQQMSLYLENMASDSTKLLPLLKNGGEGFKFWADAADRAGAIMDESAIKKVGELQVQMDLLNLQVKGVKNQFIQGFIPSLTAVGDSLTGATAETNLFSDAGETLGYVLKGVAAIALGVYASVKLVTNAVAGLAVDAVNAKNLVDSASESGTWADKLPGIKLAKTAIFGATLARADTSATKMAVDDNRQIIADVDNSITKLFDNTVNKAVQAMAESRKGLKGLNDGSKEWEEKQNKVAKATNNHAKAQKEVNKAYEDAQKLLYDYGTEFQRIEHDLTAESKKISTSVLNSSDKSRMLAEAKSISEARKQVYLLEYESDLDSWNWTEDQKLKKTLDLEAAKVKSMKGMSADEKKLRIDSLSETHKHEMAWLRLEQAERLNSAQEAFQTEMQQITSKYEFERERIKLNLALSADDKDALIGASERTQDLENDERRRQAWGDFQNAAGFDTSAEDEQSRRNKAFKQALEWQLITQEEYQQRMLQSEAQFNIAKSELALDVTGNTLGSWADMFKNLLGEQSGAYKTMLIADRAVAITRALLNVPEAYSEAFNAVVGTPYIGPYIAPIVGGAAAAVQVGQVALVKGIDVGGIFHGGMDYVPKETSYLLDEGERVLSPRQNSDFTEFMQRENSSSNGTGISLTVNVQTLPGTTADVSLDNNQLKVVVRKEIDDYLPGQLSRASSPVSQAFSTYYSVPRVR